MVKLLLTKMPKYFNRERLVFSTNNARKLDVCVEKKLTVTLAHAKITLKVYDSLKQKAWCDSTV